MKRLILLLSTGGAILLLSSLLYSARTDADPLLQVAVTPTVFHDLPSVYRDWTLTRCCDYKVYGMNFSPYIGDGEDPDKGGDQITDEELKERIGLIAPHTEWIRTFGCNNDLKEAGEYAHDMGLKAAVGAWLGREPEAEQENRKQIDCLKQQAKEGHVDIAIVGSEVLLRGDLSEDKLIGYIHEVKQYFQGEGIDVPVTYADIYGVLLSHPNVISTTDLVFANYYPYWEGRKIDHAVAYIHRWHQQVVGAAGGKQVVVSETGWPSCGEYKGEAVPSPENSSFYFLNFVSWARANNVKYFNFEAFDESWKTKHEGPQGACWGIWDRYGNLKPGMKRVFDGETMDDNWTEPIPEASTIDFPALPELTKTNIRTFLVASSTQPGNEVRLNGAPIPSDAMDETGNFAVAVPLVEGDNLVKLVIKSGETIVATAEKTIRFDEDFSTGGKRLIYVDSVAIGPGVPPITGTIVIDLDNDTLLGLIEGKHVVGISPDGGEIYTSDRTVISTTTHQELGTLPFTQDISSNAFIVSPDGARLYSRDERFDIASSILNELPIDIVTGRYSWCGASTPGGPAISDDGRKIYCIDINNIKTVDTEYSTVTNTSIIIASAYVSDIALALGESKILMADYSYGDGRLRIYDAGTFAPLATVSGLGDFAGEIAFSADEQRAVVGSAGNPASATDGGVAVIDLDRLVKISRTSGPLADNLAASGNDEFFVSSGDRLGVDVYVLGPSGTLARAKSFFLGINRFVQSTCNPKNDQIRKIVFKPGARPDSHKCYLPVVVKTN